MDIERIDERIDSLFTQMENLEVGTKEYSEAIESLAKLCRLRDEAVAHERELVSKSEASSREEEKHLAELNEKALKAKAEKWKIGTEIAKVLVPAATYIGLFLIGLDWEEEGTFTSQFLKRLITSIRPDK